MIKFFVLIFLSLHYVAEAQRNRSTVWYLANNQIYSTNAGYAACSLTGTTTATANTFLTTSNLRIAGSVFGIVKTLAAGPAYTLVSTTGQAILDSLTITFYYNSTYYLTLTLPTGRTSDATATANTVPTPAASAAFILNPLRSASYTLTSSVSTLPVVADTVNVYQPNGKVWLAFSTIPGVFTSDGGAALAANNAFSYGFVVQDYVSSSTISVVQWIDNVNAFYQFGANVLTSSITGTSVLNSGCTSIAVGKRSVDNIFRLKRGVPGRTCPSSSNDPTLTSTTLTSLCSRALAAVDNTCGGSVAASGATTTTCMADALTRGVSAIDALSTQSVLFSTSGPRVMSGGAHYLLLIGSLLFLLF